MPERPGPQPSTFTLVDHRSFHYQLCTALLLSARPRLSTVGACVRGHREAIRATEPGSG